MIHPARRSPSECKNHVRDLLAIELPLRPKRHPQAYSCLPCSWLMLIASTLSNRLDLIDRWLPTPDIILPGYLAYPSSVVVNLEQVMLRCLFW